MRKLFVLITIFAAMHGAAAQTPRATEGRDPLRSGIVSCPTAAEAAGATAAASKYLAPLAEWTAADGAAEASFTVPFAWANRRVGLHMPPMSGEYEVYVGGTFAGYNADPGFAADFDITKKVREGRNTVEIRSVSDSPALVLESRDQAAFAAPAGAYVFSRPTMYVRDVAVRTWRTEGAAKAEVGVVVRTGALNPKTSRIHYELRSPDGATMHAGHGDMTLDMRREDTLRFVVAVPDTLLWSAARPVRCRLLLKTQYEGRYGEYLSVPLGFRTAEVCDGRLTVNGEPVALRAAEVAPALCAADIARLRAEGCNLLRFRPGPVPEGLYDLCDSLGIYVVAQAPIDTHRSGDDIRRGGNPSNDPEWLGAYLERTEDAYHAAKRHPSVVAFSPAVRSANGINLYECYLRMKRTGDTRPVVYTEAGGQWNSDRLDMER